MAKRTLLLVLTLVPLLCHSQQLRFDPLWSKSFVVELNQIREQQGLPPLRYNRTLSKQSYIYSKSMAKRSRSNGKLYLEHANPKWLFISLYDEENISFGEDPLQLWMDSPPHRSTMMNRSMKRVGVSCYEEYCTLRVKSD